MTTPLQHNDCKDHTNYTGLGKRPRTGCARCWKLWLWGSEASEADAQYIAKLQREHLKRGKPRLL